MRTRLIVLAALVGALVTVGVTGLASAAPHQDKGLTLTAAPNPIIAGESVVIYGQLQGSDVAGQTIYLYHRVNPAARFTLVSHTTTDASGGYEFTRQVGVVMSNRSWFVRGPDGTHSATVKEQVAALVTLHASTTTSFTGSLVVFNGRITPSHAFERVLLQQQTAAAGDVWRTIAVTRTNRDSHFSVVHGFRYPGDKTLRAVFTGDRRNVAGDSDSVTLIVQQREKPAFTLTSSSPIIAEGRSVTLSGKLYKAGTTDPKAGVNVTLHAENPNGRWHVVDSIPTASDGSYAFTVTPTYNTTYRATTKAGRVSAPLSQGVQDVVTINQSSDTAEVGGTVTISGNVSPAKSGHEIFLQQLGDDGAWHDVEASNVTSASTYSFIYQFGEAGAIRLRARVFGGPWNVGAASRMVTVEVSGVATPSDG